VSDSQVSEVLGWSRSQIPRGLFCPTPEIQLDHFLHQTPKLGIPVLEMVQFLLKILIVYHDFH